MGIYRIRIPRARGRSSRERAVERARREAAIDGVRVFGEPKLRRKNAPVPLFGPRRSWVVTFHEATKIYGGQSPSREALRDAGYRPSES